MKLLDVTVAVVGTDRARVAEIASALRAEGAIARTVVGADDLSASLQQPLDAIVLALVGESRDWDGMAPQLPSAVTRILVVDENRDVKHLSRVGPADAVVLERDAAACVDALARLTHRSRALAEATRIARLLEDRLRGASGRLEMVGDDARVLAHDAGVLCGLVVGYGANLRDGIAGPITEQQIEHTRRIIDAANEIAALLQAFVASTRDRVESAELDETPPPSSRGGRRTLCDVSETVRSTARLFEGVAQKKRIRLEVSADAPVRAWCDVTEIKQVVTNLVVNAIKFAPAGERVFVGVRSRGTEAHGHVEIVVADGGPGIPAGERERIFVLGARLERDARVAGSGIGLSVVKDIVSRHGGTVAVADTPGGGATFTITFPIDMRARRAQMPESLRRDETRAAEDTK